MTLPDVAPPALRSRTSVSVRPSLWVVVGLVGILLTALGVGVDMHGLLETGTSWWRPLITLPGQCLLALAWWQLGPAMRRPLLVLGLWSLAMLLVPPIFSRDAYSYAAQGWLMGHGLDPYTVPSGQAGEAGLLVGVHWYETTSVYPPIALKLFEGVSWLFGGRPYLSVIGMRLPNLVALALMAWLLPRLAARVGVRRSAVLWAGLLNPVVVMQWVGGIHNDAVMVALVTVAFFVAHDTAWKGWRGLLLGGAVIGLAMCVKQSAAVAGVAMVALAWAAILPRLPEKERTWLNLGVRAVASGLVAVLVFLGVSFATGLGLGWRNESAGNPLETGSNAPVSWVASFFRFHELLSPEGVITVFTALCGLLVVAAMLWLLWGWGPRPPHGAGRPWLLAAGSLVAFAVLGPALQPWYLTWAIPFVILARPGLLWQHTWLLATVTFTVLPPLQELMAPWVAMPLVALPMWLVWRWLRRHRAPVFPAPSPSRRWPEPVAVVA